MDMVHTKIVTSQVKMCPTEEADFSVCDKEMCVSNVDDNLGYTIHNKQVFLSDLCERYANWSAKDNYHHQPIIHEIDDILSLFQFSLFSHLTCRCIHKTAKSKYELCQVCLSVCMKQLSYCWIDFHEL